MSDIHALSGAYAVDAVDDIERASFERHLASCPTCRAEVASLREASALLADAATTTPPPELRDAVLSGITRVRPLPPVTVGGPVHRRRWFPALVAAVVLALVGVGGAVWQPWRDDTSVQAERHRPGPPGPRRRAVHPGAAQRGDGHRRALRRRSTVRSSSPRTCPRRRTGRSTSSGCSRRPQDMISAGLMPAGADTALLEGNANDAVGAGVSLEPAGGSDQPTEVVALFDFEAA